MRLLIIISPCSRFEQYQVDILSTLYFFIFFWNNFQIIFFYFKIEDEPEESNDPRNQFSKKSKVSVSVATGLRRDSNIPAVIFIIIINISYFDV